MGSRGGAAVRVWCCRGATSSMSLEPHACQASFLHSLDQQRPPQTSSTTSNTHWPRSPRLPLMRTPPTHPPAHAPNPPPPPRTPPPSTQHRTPAGSRCTPMQSAAAGGSCRCCRATCTPACRPWRAACWRARPWCTTATRCATTRWRPSSTSSSTRSQRWAEGACVCRPVGCGEGARREGVVVPGRRECVVWCGAPGDAPGGRCARGYPTSRGI